MVHFLPLSLNNLLGRKSKNVKQQVTLVLMLLCKSVPEAHKIPCVELIQVSEKRWYWLKVFALATIKDWAALEKFSKEKKPPIGKFINLVYFVGELERKESYSVHILPLKFDQLQCEK